MMAGVITYPCATEIRTDWGEAQKLAEGLAATMLTAIPILKIEKDRRRPLPGRRQEIIPGKVRGMR